VIALSPLGRKTIDTVRDEASTQLSGELVDLTDEERATLAAAVPVLRTLADRHLDG
jgi:hypothetical protein